MLRTLVKAKTQTCLESQVGAIRAYPGGRLKAIKRRRGTVKTIGKITKTMKVVASSKLGPAQAKAKSVSPFFTAMKKTFDTISPPSPTSKILTLVVCTDKGLCGSTNNALTRSLLKEDLSNQTIVVWGDKGCGAFERSKFKENVVFSAHPSQKFSLSYLEVSAVVERLIKEDFDYLRIVFNRMVTQSSPEIDQLFIPSFKTIDNDDIVKYSLVKFDTEATNHREMLHNLSEYYITSAINYASFHNQAVEMFARRNSMDNASKNAEKIAQDLLLKFNRERQSIITTELGEITSGAAAVEEGSKSD